jgi:hypothetical protein
MPLIAKSCPEWMPRPAGGLALSLAVLAAMGSISEAVADTSCSLDAAGGAQGSATAVERLLSNIKAELSGSHILRVEQRSRDLEGLRLIYAVKVLPPDGRVTWLKFDACSLEPLSGPRDRATNGGSR